MAETVQGELQDELKNIRRIVRKPTLQYRSLRTGINATVEFLVELRRSETRSVPPDWMQVSTTKEFIRYHTPRVLELMQRLALHREEIELEARKAWSLWLADVGAACAGPLRAAVRVLAQLDCLASLAVVARMPGYTRPMIVDSRAGAGSGPVIDVVGGRHPMAELAGSSKVSACATRCHSARVSPRLPGDPRFQHVLGAPSAAGTETQFVPNDVALGGANARWVWGGAAEGWG